MISPSSWFLPKREVTGDRTYGLSTVWVNPHQARVSTVEEAVRKLTTLVSSGPYWPYALVWPNENTLPCTTPQGGAPRHLT